MGPGEKRLIIEKAIENPMAIIAERCRRSLYYTVQYFWDEVSADEPVWNWHIPYICHELEQLAFRVANKIPSREDVIINIAPGSTKSLLCSIMFPVWCWMNWYWMRFITGTYSGTLTLEHAEKSRDIIRSEKWKRLFPHLHIVQDKEAKSNFQIINTEINKKGGNRYSTSVGGTLTGFHGHILIVDDPLNPEESHSEVSLRKANRWLGQTLSTRKIMKTVSPIILIMQRLHQDDPTGHRLNQKKPVKHICLPADIFEFPGLLKPPELFMQYKDGLMDPVRMPREVLKDFEVTLGQYAYAGQFGQNPVPAKGGMFKTDMMSVIQQMPTHHEIVDIVRYWDKAGTQGGGAYTAGVKIAKLRSGKYLVMDVKRGQWATHERERIIRATAEADGPLVTVWIEQEPGSGGKESAQATITNLDGFRAYAERPMGDKVFRADPWSVQVNNGNVLLLLGDWNKEYIEEHHFFPLGKYKDQVDASSGGHSKFQAKRRAGSVLGRR